MIVIKELSIPGYKKVIEAKDPECGLHSFIAIHDSSLGPALGGVRIYPYLTDEEALTDVLRLAQAMTSKSAIAGCGTGGGKSVIIADQNTKTEELLRAFGAVVNSLGGDYIAAEDVGSTPEDMSIIRQATPFVSALPTVTSSGDPSRFTAWGTLRGMQAAAQHLWGSSSLKNKSILIQGLGNVGSKLASFLFWEGANLLIAEQDPQKALKEAALYGAQIIDAKDIYSTPCDIFSPCAMGGIITKEIIPELKCHIIAGSANNQLLSEDLGIDLMDRKILYAPDYIINAGGLINATSEFDPNGYDAKVVREKVEHIYDTLLTLFNEAKENHRPTTEIAEEMAHHYLDHLIGKREHPIKWAS